MSTTKVEHDWTRETLPLSFLLAVPLCSKAFGKKGDMVRVDHAAPMPSLHSITLQNTIMQGVPLLIMCAFCACSYLSLFSGKKYYYHFCGCLLLFCIIYIFPTPE